MKRKRGRSAGNERNVIDSFVSYWHAHVETEKHFNYDVENLVVLLLSAKYSIRGHCLIAIGSLTEIIAHPREVFRPAIIGAAFSIVIMHNHPSGDPTPSQADVSMTQVLHESGGILDIMLYDHVIVANAAHYSFRENCHL